MDVDARLRVAAGTTLQATVGRIVATWERATPGDVENGAQWYAEAEAFVDTLALATGHSREAVAAVVAHLSPRTRWQRNLYGATMLLTAGTAPTCLGRNVAAARRALASRHPLATLAGPKTQRFAANLLGDRERVTVDVWSVRVALGVRDDAERVFARAGMYEAVEHAYRVAARRIGVDPATLQATTWIVARNGRAT